MFQKSLHQFLSEGITEVQMTFGEWRTFHNRTAPPEMGETFTEVYPGVSKVLATVISIDTPHYTFIVKLSEVES